MNETIMHKEIMMIPESLKLTESYNDVVIKEFKEVFRKKDIKNVVVVARGSSDNVGVYLKYLFEIYLHVPVSFAACSVVTKYNSYINFDKTLVIGISQSGSGEDICEYLNMSKKYGALTLAITNNLSSICSEAADYNFYLNLSKEEALAATKTFISQMYIVLRLTEALSENNDLEDSIKKLNELVLQVLNNENKICDVANKCKDFIDCYLLSRGINYVSSLEGALKIQETTFIKAKAYASSDFYHGPLAIVDQKQNIFLLASNGKTEDDNHKIYDKVRSLGANIIVITNDDYYKNEKLLIKIPDCSEEISPFLIIISIQLLVCEISRLKGIDVDHSRNLNKITITR